MMTDFDFGTLTVRGKPASEYGFSVSGPSIDPLIEDAAFYCEGTGSAHVASVTLNGRQVDIYCDGVMRVMSLNEPYERYNYNGALVDAGFRNDEELFDAEKRREIEFLNNPWFDLYDYEGEHLDRIAHTYSDALQEAMELLLLEATV
jgi:hypothetical protein